MQDMIDFSMAFLRSVSDWLSNPPIIYIFGLFCFGVIVDVFLDIIHIRR